MLTEINRKLITALQGNLINAQHEADQGETKCGSPPFFFCFQRKRTLHSETQKRIRTQKSEQTNRLRKQPCTLLFSFKNVLMLSGSKLGEQVGVRKEKHYPKPRRDSHLSMPYALDQSGTQTQVIVAKDWAFQLDKLLPHLISQDWAIFISEHKTSGNLRWLLMSFSSLMLLKHCHVITMESDKTFVVWNRTQKSWILTKIGCR